MSDTSKPDLEKAKEDQDREPRHIAVREHDLLYLDRTRLRLKPHPDSDETFEIIRVTKK